MAKNFSSNSVHLEVPSHRILEKNSVPLNLEKLKIETPNTVEMTHKQAILNRIEDLRKRTQTPQIDKQFIDEKQERERNDERVLKKVESVSVVQKRPPTREKSLELPLLRKSVQIEEAEMRANLKSEKNDGAIGRKLIDDLRNEKDWKVRLEAIEELQTKFYSSKGTPEIESMAKNFLPVLIKLLGDPNFKVALIALKIIEEIILF